MKIYLLLLGAALLVGLLSGLLNVRSPAPPLVALAGLLGILADEQVRPVRQQLLAVTDPCGAWREAESQATIVVPLHGRHAGQEQAGGATGGNIQESLT